MTETYILLAWTQAVGGLVVSLVLFSLYAHFVREKFVRYWALSYAYSVTFHMFHLVAEQWPLPTRLQTNAIHILVLPKFVFLALAVASVLGMDAKHQRRSVAWAVAGLTALQLGLNALAPDPQRLASLLQAERFFAAGVFAAAFCLAFGRRHPMAAARSAWVFLGFTALQAAHNTALAAAIAARTFGVPVYLDPASPLDGLVSVGLSLCIAVGLHAVALESASEANRKLRSSEERYRQLLATSPDSLIVSTLDGTITMCNQRTLDLFGYDRPEQLVGSKGCPLTAPRDRKRIQESIQKMLAGEPLRDVRLQLQRRDGSTFPGETTATALRNADGKPSGWISMTRDISARVLALERVRLLADALESASDCVSITDMDGRLVYVNRAFLSTYEYTEEEILGKDTRILSAQGMKAVNTTSDTLIDGWRGELWNESKSGRLFPISLVSSVVHQDDGEAIAMIGVARDISKEKAEAETKAKLEADLRQALKMESIGRLAGGVAHDFNNLLTVINGYSEMLLSDLSKEQETWRRVEQIHKAGTLAAELTQQLLAFSSKQTIEPKPVNLNALLQVTDTMLRRLLPVNISIATRLDPVLGWAVADPGQIQRVLLNLATNARDAMPDGGTLTIQTSNVEIDRAFADKHSEFTAGACVLLEFTDTGIGMEESVARHIFEPFFTTKKSSDGTGLGLATVYGIVRQVGGWIWVDSAPGKGTCFRLYFPRVVPRVRENGNEMPAVESASRRHKQTGSGTVLLVEDREDVRNLVRAMLEEDGYTVLQAHTAEAAIEVSARFKDSIDLLLTDVVMPGMAGNELARRLAVPRPAMKVIYMSGYTENAIANQGMPHPGISYIQKPMTSADLSRKVRAALLGVAPLKAASATAS